MLILNVAKLQIYGWLKSENVKAAIIKINPICSTFVEKLVRTLITNIQICVWKICVDCPWLPS